MVAAHDTAVDQPCCDMRLTAVQHRSRQSPRLLGTLVGCLVVVLLNNVAAQSHDGLMVLDNGDQMTGRLAVHPDGESIRWMAAGFTEPFQFPVTAIRTIEFPQDSHSDSAEPFVLTTINGDTISGRLVGGSDEEIQIVSSRLGLTRVRIDAINRLLRVEDADATQSLSRTGRADWSRGWSIDQWRPIRESLVTSAPGAVVASDANLPGRAVVELELSWLASPDFVIALGTDGQASTWRLETVDQDLVLVREHARTADVQRVVTLRNQSNLKLTLYLDHGTQEIHVIGGDGRQLADLPQHAEGGVDAAGGVRIINRGSGLSIDDLRITPWMGELPGVAASGPYRFVLANGSFLTGGIDHFDAEAGALVVGNRNRQSIFPFEDLRAMLALEPRSPGATACTVTIAGGQQVSGQIDSVTAEHLVVTGDEYSTGIRVPRHDIRTISIRGVTRNAARAAVDGRIGRIERDSDRLTGRMVLGAAADRGVSPLHWRPLDSLNGSNLRADYSGRIVYRNVPNDVASMPSRSDRRGLDFGRRFIESVTNVDPRVAARNENVIHLRDGDVIACKIGLIDKRGVHVMTTESDDGFVPHEQVKAVELARQARMPDLEAAKRERLLVLPRLQKSAPPTHLLCAHDGDVLRCRLLRASDEAFVVEVQKSILDVPRSRVAQIIWFHPDELVSEPNDREQPPTKTSDPDPNLDGMVRAFVRGGKRLTFRATQASETTITGENEFVGPCSIHVSQLDQLVLGQQISQTPAKTRYDNWVLTPATEPLAFQETNQDAENGLDSPLVGKMARDIDLPLLDGGTFRLSEQKGKVVVLDFWASWCAPCIQTMPLLETGLERFEPNQLQLVSINVGESADQAVDVRQRLGLSGLAALDADSSVATEFEVDAIPRTIVIDQNGIIARVFVGGGQALVEKIQGASLLLIAGAASPGESQ